MNENQEANHAELDQAIKELQKEKAKHEAETARLASEKARHEAQKALNEAAISSEVSELQKQKAIAEAEKALFESTEGLEAAKKLLELKSKKELADAEKALAESQKALNDAESEAGRNLTQLEQQKKLIDAEKALADARKALQDAESPSGQDLTQLEQQKKLADAQKALVDAQSQAGLARLIGSTKAGPYTGSVDIEDKAGLIESKLLAADAIQQAAKKIAKAVGSKATKFFVFDTATYSGFQKLTAFRFHLSLIEQAYSTLDAEMAQAGDEAVSSQIVEESFGSIPAAAAVSGGLEALSNILGHLKTDYTVQGLELSLDDSILTFSVAGALSDYTNNEVHLPTLYSSTAGEETVKAFSKSLGGIDNLRRQFGQAVKQRQTEIDSKQTVAQTKTGKEKQEALSQIEELKTSINRIKEVNESYDQLLASQTTADEAGNVPLSNLLQEFALERSLTAAGNNGAILLLKIEHSGGGYLMKKNILTGLGGMPLWHMGGSTVTYLLMRGITGAVIAGDVIPIHGGFVKSGSVRQRLERRS